ncbi:SLC13 family permease [Pararobbsia silviterrae]|uniref:Citrate transporter n=1 Tax=Pararobbsia silviterrae TaxID=1792498 RepID=A0A494Y6Z3_9BURK|nr:SLC13 family permease [Pararobbsia silviterrae]RKP58489.1 citrate transporter [Pararobbsia silviterrae]
MRSIVAFIKREAVLIVLLVALIALQALRPQSAHALIAMIDGETLLTLGGLLVLTKAIEHTGAMHWAAQRLIHRVHTERGLALVLVLFAAAISTVLTNDVALFAVIPIAISIQQLVALSLRRLVIVIAIAVNAGSILTPLGNPQNLFLWHASGVSFGGFVVTLAPLTLILIAGLVVLTCAIFHARRLDIPDGVDHVRVDRRAFAIAAVTFAAFVAIADLHHAAWGCALVLIVFGVSRWRTILEIDWLLLAVFALMFIVLRSVANLPLIHDLCAHANLDEPMRAYVAGAITSQVISNVPAAIMLESFTQRWQALAYGVSVGGFGWCIGSLANLIAMRLAPVKGLFWRFHLLSLPFFVFAAIAGAYLIHAL